MAKSFEKVISSQGGYLIPQAEPAKNIYPCCLCNVRVLCISQNPVLKARSEIFSLTGIKSQFFSSAS
jgi:hypothetical protein